METSEPVDLQDQSGQTMAEYAIVLAVLSLGIVISLYLVQASITSRLIADVNTLIVGLQN